METDKATANASCTVAVTDSTGALTATSAVTFYTNATVYSPAPEQSDISGGKSNNAAAHSAGWCISQCPQLFNVLCTLRNACYTRLAKVRGAAAWTALAVDMACVTC